MPVAGLRGTGSWGADERPKNFRESIAFYGPNGTAPIFALSLRGSKKKVDDPEFSWWAESKGHVRLQTSGAHATTDTMITVTGTEPTTTTPKANYGSAQHLKEGDVLLVEPVTDSAAFTHELLQVQQVLSATQFVVTRSFAGTTVTPTLSTGTWLTLISNAYAEGTGAPRSATRNPMKFLNYTQIFKDTYEITGTADKTRARTGDAWGNDKKRKGFDHARAIELSILFGRKSEGIGENGQPIRTFGGIREFLPATNVTVFGAAITEATFLNALAPMFTHDTGAGNSRLMFVGGAAMIAISKAFTAASNITFNNNDNVKVYGYDFKKAILPMGTVNFAIHPLLSQHPLYEKSGFILDFDAFKYVYLEGRDTKTTDDVQTKEEDVRRGLIQTECSVMVDYGGATMGYLGNITFTP